MKVVIFAGGMGTRISEESLLRPKPMIEIGDKPILWHIMKIFSSQGFNDFIICLGYKGYMIKEYFSNYFLHNSDVTIDLRNNTVSVHNTNAEDLKVTLVDTGLHTKTAGRLKRIQHHVGNEDFMLTYGDGVADIDLAKLLAFHRSHGKTASVTAIQPMGRFGVMQINPDSSVDVFKEKVKDDEGWINGGFFVLRPDVFNYLPADADDTMWEDTPIANLAKSDQLMAFQHQGFWKCMDAMRDKIELEEIWNSGKARWKRW
ncbi:MAG TPA: glucose-1-phosphate cytidylyltransferase [Puia sp.]|jgi:glucose-1-phosphate cytidylyltransferase|nr:glucose-1-phosphate cytidylyltransferase [Puia sp.]